MKHEKVYKCPHCKKKHVFPVYYYAGVGIPTIHTCDCGAKNTILRFEVTDTVKPPVGQTTPT